MNMKRIILLALTAVIALSVNAQTPEAWKGLKRGLNFIWSTIWGAMVTMTRSPLPN